MNKETKTIVIVAVVLLLAVGVYAFGTKKLEIKPGNIFNSADHNKIQDFINQMGNDPATVDNFNHRKAGGSHGVPGNAKTIKPLIFAFAVNKTGVTSGSWSDYSYPSAFIFDESTDDGVERNPKDVPNFWNQAGDVAGHAFASFIKG